MGGGPNLTAARSCSVTLQATLHMPGAEKVAAKLLISAAPMAEDPGLEPTKASTGYGRPPIVWHPP